MNKLITLSLAGVLLGSAAALAGAGKDVTIRFDARVGDKALRCGETYTDLGKTGAKVSLQDFRIYVSEVRLVSADGRETPVALTPDDAFQSDRVALLDFENATGNCNGNAPMHTEIEGQAPAGDYVGLAFTIGVPADLNHADPTLAGPPLNFSALGWPWRYGYKFTTIDLETGRKPDMGHGGHEASGFSIHLGSVDCGDGAPTTPPETPCATPNRPEFRLKTFDPAKDIVVLDLAALLAETDVTVNAPDSPSGCMSGADDDDCVAIMDRFGLSFRGKTSSGQRFVRTVPAN